ncbi:hypothetical protein SSP24_10690 [Streptomyces spinoverrucosus]|uniref:Uncharacterized protein n=1 Tax=Streptomyces spinoverrucosus TaxID=284043 RepID=A0A4Y3V981_9ACTN|nr:hypothetical protein SSP24_10690 [Streptomyces spinoverrucosus]GHB35849.1 hypothetical protein GCM10010397_01880 [Streptomyces spinoverrucosus]
MGFRRVIVRLRVRRYFCDRKSYSRKTFVELADLLEQAAGNGAAFRPPLMEVGFVGVEDAGPAGPPPDQELVRGGHIGEAADGVAGQAQSAGDRPQAEPLIQQGVDGRVLLAQPGPTDGPTAVVLRGRRRKLRALQGLGGTDRGRFSGSRSRVRCWMTVFSTASARFLQMCHRSAT